MLSHVRNIIKTRLCQKLIAVVILSITLISLAIFIPHFIAEHKKHEKGVESAAELLIQTMSTSLSYGVPIKNAEMLYGGHKVVGYEVCDLSNCELKFGESITGFADHAPSEKSIYQNENTRFEVRRPILNKQKGLSQITLRIDTTTLNENTLQSGS